MLFKSQIVLIFFQNFRKTIYNLLINKYKLFLGNLKMINFLDFIEVLRLLINEKNLQFFKIEE